MESSRLDRRGFLGLAAAGTAFLGGPVKVGSSALEVRPTVEEGLDSYNVRDWGVEGKGWTDTEARPKTPILLVEDRTYANTRFLPGFQERHRGSRAELRKAYQSLRSSGIQDLHYLEGQSAS